ncbi:MAG: ATP-binding protein, partial [Gammaproteobacteria bacterium]|nr:ATP-binding protein [Gammaproteobacteria bacterium]
SGMADIVGTLNDDVGLVHPEPIDVARGLVAIFDRLPNWTKRTMQLSDNAVRFREIFKRARDPNQFLFNDLPAVKLKDASANEADSSANLVESLKEGLQELVLAYPSMLHRLQDTMLCELQVPNLTPQSIEELKCRARNVQQTAGDFRVEAFVQRIAQFDGSEAAFEGIASLVANKPPRDWVDLDFDKSMVEIAELAQKFLRIETFARVKGRPEKRNAMAVIVGLNGRPAPVHEEFDVGDTDRAAIDDLVLRMQNLLADSDSNRQEVILAALAELSLRYMSEPSSNTELAAEDLISNE